MKNPRRQGIYILAAGLLAALAVLVVWLAVPPGVPSDTRGVPSDTRGVLPDTRAVPRDTRVPPDTRPTPAPAPPGQVPTPDPATPTGPGTPLWQALDESAVPTLPDYAPEWSTEGRVLVQTSAAMEAAGGWRVGDRLTLPVPQLGAVYRPLIDEIDDGPGGSRSVLGMVRGDDGRDRRYVVTVGPAHVFAYVDTPNGPYELSGGRELGWLLPTSSMMAGVDHSEPDYILPEIHEMH